MPNKSIIKFIYLRLKVSWGKCPIRINKFTCLILIIYFSPFTVFASKLFGRVTLGAVVIKEQYKTNDFGSDSNDSLFSSNRLFLKGTELFNDQWSSVLDARNTYDQFGKLNKEQLRLEAKNTFHFRQLSFGNIESRSQFRTNLGRFSLNEAGGVYVDGLQLDCSKCVSVLNSGIFTGYNPKSPEKTELEFNDKATQVGGYITYKSSESNWDTYSYISHAFVQQKYFEQIERKYLFQQINYQWDEFSRWNSTVFLDFYSQNWPSSKIQTMSLFYQQEFSSQLDMELNYIKIDALEYQRKQSVLENLPSSPFSESGIQINLRQSTGTVYSLSYSKGLRELDQLSLETYKLGLELTGILNSSIDLRLFAGAKNNFTSADTFIRGNVGYFSKNWEITLDQTIEQAKYKDTSETSNQYITELGATSFFGKTVFVTTSFQRASDNKVDILSLFFKLGYRFGFAETAPIRDGSAPRGAL